MGVRSAVGQVALAISGFIGSKTAALAAANPEYITQFTASYSLVGIKVPNWFGIVFFLISLLFGTWVGATQESPVDKYFKHRWLKSIYAFGFGVLMSVFVMPRFYPDITLWGLIAPVAFFSAIGGVSVYYLVAIFTKPELWRIVERVVRAKAKRLGEGGSDETN